MAIHKDPPSKCTKKGYIRFLIRSPLEVCNVALGTGLVGSFGKLHYWQKVGWDEILIEKK